MAILASIYLLVFAVVIVQADIRQQFLDEHNKYRAAAGASNMYKLEWHDGIAADAQRAADKCVFMHSSSASRSNKYSFLHIGENIAMGTGNVSAVVKMWHDEKKYYTYSTKACSSVCGHYTQVVWADSFKLGCGMSDCEHGGRRHHITFCQYAPGGNYNGRRPFKRGSPCSECTNDNNRCSSKLCVGPPACKDTSSSETCAKYVSWNCANDKNYMAFYADHCKKSCKLCDYY